MSTTPASRAWSWRHAITRSGLPATTRHVLLTLSLYMNEFGEGCNPSIKDLERSTGLSHKAVVKHLGDAADAGWLERRPHGFGGQKWKRLEYIAAWPGRDLDAQEEVESTSEKGGSPGEPPFKKGGSPGEPKAVAQGNQGKDSSKDIPKKEIPPTPLEGGRAPDSPNHSGWDTFEAAFTADGVPIQKPSLAKRVLATLTADECDLVTRAATGYLAYRRAERKPTTKLAAHTFLRERDAWGRFAGLAHVAIDPLGRVDAFSRTWWWCLYQAVLTATSPAALNWINRQVTGALQFGARWSVDPSKRAEIDATSERNLTSHLKDGEHARIWRDWYRAKGLEMPIPDKAEVVWLPAVAPPGSEQHVDRDHHQVA